MAGQNGALVLIYVATAPDSVGTSFVRVAGQKNVDFNDTTAQIDLSDKLSGRLGERVAGRATASVSLEVNVVQGDPAQTLIKQAYRNRETILVQHFRRNDPDSLVGVAVEEAEGLIVDLSESHPDQDASTMNLEVSLNNDWVAA